MVNGDGEMERWMDEWDGVEWRWVLLFGRRQRRENRKENKKKQKKGGIRKRREERKRDEKNNAPTKYMRKKSIALNRNSACARTAKRVLRIIWSAKWESILKLSFYCCCPSLGHERRKEVIRSLLSVLSIARVTRSVWLFDLLLRFRFYLSRKARQGHEDAMKMP